MIRLFHHHWKLLNVLSVHHSLEYKTSINEMTENKNRSRP